MTRVLSDPTTGLLDRHSLLRYLSVYVAVGSPVTSLNPENVDPQVTILLEDFHKVHENIPQCFSCSYSLQYYRVWLMEYILTVKLKKDLLWYMCALVRMCMLLCFACLFMCLVWSAGTVCWSQSWEPQWGVFVLPPLQPNITTLPHFSQQLHTTSMLIVWTFDLSIMINSHTGINVVVSITKSTDWDWMKNATYTKHCS